MGNAILILMVGFSSTLIIQTMNKNRIIIDSADRTGNYYYKKTVEAALSSGAYLALNKLYLDRNWRAGYQNRVFNGVTINVTVHDHSTDSSIDEKNIQINVEAQLDAYKDSSTLVVLKDNYKDFAVWARGDVQFVTAIDSGGNVNPSCLARRASSMPPVENDKLRAAAAAQGRVINQTEFVPEDGYPNGSFYYYRSDPNVTHVRGNLRIKAGRTIAGVFIVEGDVIAEKGAGIRGVLYQPNATSKTENLNDIDGNSFVTGYLLTSGSVNGNGNQITVRHKPNFVRRFTTRYAAKTPDVQILGWR